MIVAQKTVCLPLAEPALLAVVAEAVVAEVEEAAYKLAHQLLAQRVGAVMNGLIASQMVL